MSTFEWFLIFAAPSFLLVALGVAIPVVIAGLVAVIAALCIDIEPVQQRVIVFIFLPGGLQHA